MVAWEVIILSFSFSVATRIGRGHWQAHIGQHIRNYAYCRLRGAHWTGRERVGSARRSVVEQGVLPAGYSYWEEAGRRRKRECQQRTARRVLYLDTDIREGGADAYVRDRVVRRGYEREESCKWRRKKQMRLKVEGWNEEVEERKVEEVEWGDIWGLVLYWYWYFNRSTAKMSDLAYYCITDRTKQTFPRLQRATTQSHYPVITPFQYTTAFQILSHAISRFIARHPSIQEQITMLSAEGILRPIFNGN